MLAFHTTFSFISFFEDSTNHFIVALELRQRSAHSVCTFVPHMLLFVFFFLTLGHCTSRLVLPGLTEVCNYPPGCGLASEVLSLRF